MFQHRLVCGVGRWPYPDACSGSTSATLWSSAISVGGIHRTKTLNHLKSVSDGDEAGTGTGAGACGDPTDGRSEAFGLLGAVSIENVEECRGM
jgi:hypothetical protein